MIEEVVIVSGFAGCGKSRLVRGIFAGRWPSIVETLRLNVNESWVVCDSASLPGLVEDGTERRVVLEYGILRPEAPDWGAGAALQWVQQAQRTTTLAVWCEPGVLARRIRRRLWRTVARAPIRLLHRRRKRSSGLPQVNAAASRSRRASARSFVRQAILLHGSLAVLYREYPNVIRDIFDRWVDYAAGLPDGAVWIIDTTEEIPCLRHPEEWRRKSANARS